MSVTDTRMETIENATRDDVRPGDHLTWTQVTELYGLTITERREGVAHHRDPSGDWRTDRSGRLTRGEGEGITLTIRRPVRELPTKFGAVIVPAEGHETITATDPEVGTVWRAREAACISALYWMGVWRDEDGTFSSVIPAAWIDADTWQEDSA